MKVPLAWLGEYVDLPDTQTVVERFAALGFPVEHIEQPPKISGVVVGRIMALQPHPHADRLQICTIATGEDRRLTIATAAVNVAVGQTIPVAVVGAQLPAMRIEPRNMRGIASEGMLCSAAELGLPAEWFVEGILQLEADIPLGTDVAAFFKLGEPVLEVEVTPNRPDALSMVGLARELAAVLAQPLRLPQIGTPAFVGVSNLTIDLQSPDAIGFIAQRIGNIHVGPSPTRVQIYLARANQRPINNIVDITNYVMLELGRPLHLYDAACIHDDMLIVRDARSGETLTTLDGEQRILSPNLLVVADGAGPLGLAGIRGGAASEIQPQTLTGILECAHFTPARIRRGAQALGLRTEASARFEKNPPFGMIAFAQARAAALLAEQGATLYAPQRSGAEFPKALTIEITADTIEQLLGVRLTDAEILQALEPLGFDIHAQAGVLYATVPPWRGDIHESADLAEEIARMIGYDRIESAQASIIPMSLPNGAFERERALAQALAQTGFHEVISLSLEPASLHERLQKAGVPPLKAAVEIRNPLSEDQRFLRSSLLPGLLALLERRASELREQPLNFFEIGHIFDDPVSQEERHVACWISATTKDSATQLPSWHDEGFLRFKGIGMACLRLVLGQEVSNTTGSGWGLHPGKTAFLTLRDEPIATIGALDPRLLAMYGIEADVYAGVLDLAALPERTPACYLPPSRFPGIRRDLALVLDETIPSQRVIDVVRASDSLTQEARIFDEYRGTQVGAGRKSLAVRVTLQRTDATLTDDDADAAVARIIAAVEHEIGAELRR